MSSPSSSLSLLSSPERFPSALEISPLPSPPSLVLSEPGITEMCKASSGLSYHP